MPFQDAAIPGLPSSPYDSSIHEKSKGPASIETTLEKGSLGSSVDHEDVVMLNGEPVVTSGRDVSRFVVDIRDDGEDALTFRSICMGTVFAGLGAALRQVSRYDKAQIQLDLFVLDLHI